MKDFQISLINAAGSNSVVVTARDEATAKLAAECTYSEFRAGVVTKVWPAGTIYGALNASESTDDDVAYMRDVIAARRAAQAHSA